MAEIIEVDLSSDDDICEVIPDPKPKKKNRFFKCLNPECRSTENLSQATLSDRRYYGVLTFPKKTRICSKCRNVANNHKQSVIDLIRSGHNIMDKEINISKNTMILPDSDSDKTDEEILDDESEYEFDFSEISEGAVETGGRNAKNTDKLFATVLSDIISKINLNQHLNESKDIIYNRLRKAEKEFTKLNEEYKRIEKSIDKVRNNFYDTFKSDIRWLPSLEIGPPDTMNAVTEVSDVTEVIPDSLHLNLASKLPLVGPLVRFPFGVGERVYTVRYSVFSKWLPAVITGVDTSDKNEILYSIEFVKVQGKGPTKTEQSKKISGKCLAYNYECSTRIPVATRIIARFEDREEGNRIDGDPCYYVGIIAEVPNGVNKYRYLIFFDDGYAQYVSHQDIRVVGHSSSAVWEDVAPESKDFIRDYLLTYPERPMVRLQKFNYIKTELNGKWWKAQVLDVDGSLAKMYFPCQSRTEWIYRGSTRLSPLFNKKMNMQIKSEHQSKIIRRRTLPSNRSGPVVEYINFNKDEEQQQNEILEEQETEMAEERAKLITDDARLPEKRAVARKSTASKANMSVAFVHMKENLILECKGEYTWLKITEKSPLFKPHQCSSACIEENWELCKTKSLLFKPLVTGWRRQLAKQRKKTIHRNYVNYVAPCGRRFRSLEDIFRYLRVTQSKLTIDCFSDDPEVVVEREWEPCRKLYYVPDITDGKEDCTISCVNTIDSNKPKTLIYCNVRQPSENVGLNLEPEYLVCCSCEDDCQDKSKCECWQLTIESTKLIGKSGNPEAGYVFRRLNEQVITGIYECNAKCTCKNSCLNRVVQFPIRQKLQLFKTARRGWGVRTLHDLPKGAFICVYVGRVLTETEANEDGMTDGADDYYAELDFIEVIEEFKEGYESEVENSDEENDYDDENKENGRSIEGQKRSIDEDDEYNLRVAKKPSAGGMTEKSAQQGTSDSHDSEESDGSAYPKHRRQTFEPVSVSDQSFLTKFDYKSLRQCYSNDETVFIMDAKVTGNIGRYLNHSCNPNVFVQNVFVDTHDPRFPWIAFFAGMNIKAGSELTWDYNYEVDSVPGKIKYCYCQSGNCRGRLL